MSRRHQHGQHFLLKAEARTLSLAQIFRLSDQAAFDLFKQTRWPETDGEPICPRCGCIEHYWIRSREQWRCKGCRHSFSVTSSTIFSHHKLPLTTYLAAIALYSNGAKGMSALQLSRDLDVQYKTAFVLYHKLRESLLPPEQQEPLTGEVEIDGTYVGHYVRPENKKADRKDRRLAENRNPSERCIMVLRQRGKPGQGATRTIPFVARTESPAVIEEAQKHINADAVVTADEHPAYDPLHARFETLRINHSLMYCGDLGQNINQAESYFARFQRMLVGQVHKMDNRYLHNYASEVAYREDTRRWSNGNIFADVTSRCARSPVSRNFCGYWQGNKRRVERLVV